MEENYNKNKTNLQFYDSMYNTNKKRIRSFSCINQFTNSKDKAPKLK